MLDLDPHWLQPLRKFDRIYCRIKDNKKQNSGISAQLPIMRKKVYVEVCNYALCLSSSVLFLANTSSSPASWSLYTISNGWLMYVIGKEYSRKFIFS